MKKARFTISMAVMILALSCSKRHEGHPSASGAPATPACAPVYAKQPQNLSVSKGQDAELSIEVTGEGPFTYQWYEANPAASKLLPATLTKITVRPERTTSYFVWTYNKCGGRISDLATVTVK